MVQSSALLIPISDQLIEKSIIGSLLVELCRLNRRNFNKIVSCYPLIFITLIKSFPYCCLLINCINNFNVQFSRYIFWMLNSKCKLQNDFSIQFEFLLQETQWNIWIPSFASVNLLILHFAFCTLHFLEVVGQDSLSCGKATAVATVHRTVAKSRLLSPFWRLPSWISIIPVLTPFYVFLEVVGQNGLEPSTSRLSVVCSSQLSYWPILVLLTSFRYMVEISGIEPLTSCLQGRRSPSWAKPPYRRN